MTTRVVAISGGPDGTHCLQDMLRDTDDPVVAVYCSERPDGTFVRFTPGEQRYNDMCKQAADRLVVELRDRERDFEYYQITLWSGVQDNIIDGEILICELGFLHDAVVYSGRCAEDAGSETVDQIDPRFPLRVLRANLMENTKAMYKELGIEFVPYGLDTPKARIKEKLGDLWWKTWSCTSPTQDHQPCGNCRRCDDRAKAEAGVISNEEWRRDARSYHARFRPTDTPTSRAVERDGHRRMPRIR